jgi:DeoR/GlpR family transcriptional regulator of sugar metabolism
VKSFAYRQEKILEHLKKHSFVSVTALADELECSQMTVRRDLKTLEERGLLDRSHGGATASDRVKLEFALAERSATHVNEKSAIGRAAVALVRPGQKIIVHTGTTTLAMARHLVGKEGITVITTSLAVVAALLPARGAECMLLGGLVRDTSPDLYGPLLEDNLERIHPDWAFVGCDGLSVEGGLTAEDPRIARPPAIMIRNAARTVLLADSSKAKADSLISYASLKDIDILITDSAMPREILDAARAHGVETIVVDPDAGQE